MATGIAIITRALKKAGVTGVGRTPSATDSNDALDDLNDMLSQWNTDRLMTWGMVSIGLTSTGAQSYTIGPGGDYNVQVRPDRIEAAFQRQIQNPPSLQVDTPLKVIPAYEEYSRISLKTLVSYGRTIFLDSSYPLGRLFLYPIPNANQFAIYIIAKNIMPVVALATDIIIPPHYIAAMIFCLAQRLRQGYGKGMKPDPELNNLARNSLNVVQQANLQVPELVMPRALVSGGPGYNIYSDQFGSSGS